MFKSSQKDPTVLICISRARIELSFMIVRLKFWHQKETSAICIQYRYRQHKQRCKMNRMASFLSLWWKGIDFRLEIRDRKEKLNGIRQQISARKIQHAVVFKIQQQYRKRLSLSKTKTSSDFYPKRCVFFYSSIEMVSIPSSASKRGRDRNDSDLDLSTACTEIENLVDQFRCR